MKEKGFTLVELLGVITVLAIIALIVFPQIVSQIKKKEGELDGTTEKLILASVENYLDLHASTYPKEQGLEYCVTLNMLVQDGLLQPPLQTASGEEIPLTNSVQIKVLRNKELSMTYSTATCN